MAGTSIPPSVPLTALANEVTLTRIRQARDTISAEFEATLNRITQHLEAKLAAHAQSHVEDHAQGQGIETALTEHERDVLELCRSGERALAAEQLSGQLKMRRMDKRTKLSVDQSGLWKKMIQGRPDLLEAAERGVDGDENEAEDEEYRVERDPSLLPLIEPTLNNISMNVDSDLAIATPVASGSNATSSINPRKRSLSLNGKTDLRDLVPKRAKPEPRPRFKHITNALREEIVRDHITSGRGQASTVVIWKQRHPDMTITQSSLSRWIKNAENIQLANAAGQSTSQRSHTKHRIHHPEIDEDVGNAMLDLQEQGEQVTTDMIRQRYAAVCDEREVPVDSRPKMSSGWMESFGRRHNLQVVTAKAVGGGKRRQTRTVANEEDDAGTVDLQIGDEEHERERGHQHQHQLVAEGSGAGGSHPGHSYLSAVDPGLDQDDSHDIGFMAVSAAVNAVARQGDGGQIDQLGDLARGHGRFDLARERDVESERHQLRRANSSSLEGRLEHHLPYEPTLNSEHSAPGPEHGHHGHTDEASDAQRLIREVFEREQTERRGHEHQIGEVEIEAEHEGDADAEGDAEGEEVYRVDPTLTGGEID